MNAVREMMAANVSEAEMVRVKKRRASESRSGSGSAGGGLVAGETVWSGEMDSMLEALVREGDLGMLSGALERIMMKQTSELDKQDVLEKSACFGLQLQKVADKLARQQAAQHNSAVWPLTQDLTVKVSDCWLNWCWKSGIAIDCKRIASTSLPCVLLLFHFVVRSLFSL